MSTPPMRPNEAYMVLDGGSSSRPTKWTFQLLFSCLGGCKRQDKADLHIHLRTRLVLGWSLRGDYAS